MSISSSFDENILASAADQLTAASRAAFCIAAPMMKMTEHCVAVMASGGFGPALIEITGSTNLDTVVYLAAYVDFGKAAALLLRHQIDAGSLGGRHRRSQNAAFRKPRPFAALVDVMHQRKLPLAVQRFGDSAGHGSDRAEAIARKVGAVCRIYADHARYLQFG